MLPFYLGKMMAKEPPFEDEFEYKKAERSEWMRWVVPIILVLFVLLLVAGVASSSHPNNALSSGNVVVFVLAALLCTLVAVSLMLTGIGEWFKKIEENIRSLATDAVVTRVEQHRMSKASLSNSEQIGTKISLLEENHRLLREVIENTSKETNDKIAVMSEGQQQLQTDVKDLSEKTNSITAEFTNLTTQQTTINEILQTHSEAGDAQISALTTSHGQLETNVDSLRELVQTIADGVTNAAREQSASHSLVQGSIQIVTDNIQSIEKNQEILQTMVKALDQKATETATGNADVYQAANKKHEELTDKMGTFMEDRKTIHAGVNGLGEKINQLTREIERVSAEQIALSETFRDHAKALNAQMSTHNTDHERCDAAVRDLRGLTQTVADSMNNISEAQAVIRQALQDNTKALTGNTRVIEQHQTTLQAEVNKVTKTSQQIADVTTAMAREQATLHETTKAVNERLSTRVSTLSEDQKNIRTGIRTLDERIAKISAGIGSLAEEQSGLHRCLKNNKNELTDRTRVAAQDMERLRAGIRELHKAGRTLSDTVRALARLQETLTKTMKQRDQKTVDPLATLSSGRRHFQSNSRRNWKPNQKVEFEEKDYQELTAMADLISQIQEGPAHPQRKTSHTESGQESLSQSKSLPVMSRDHTQSY